MSTKRPGDGDKGTEKTQPAGEQVRNDIAALQQDMDQVKVALATFLGFEQVTAALADIAEQLEPLRDLRPRIRPYVLTETDAEELIALKAALARPEDWVEFERIPPEPAQVSPLYAASDQRAFDDGSKAKGAKS